MKKGIFAIAAALCLLAGSNASAQNADNRNKQIVKERPTVEQIAQRRTDRMTKELGLDEVQSKKVYTVVLKQQQQIESHREQMRKERQVEAAQMKSILTTEQYDKWMQMQGPRPCEHRGKMQQGKCPGQEKGKACCQNGRKTACDKKGK